MRMKPKGPVLLISHTRGGIVEIIVFIELKHGFSTSHFFGSVEARKETWKKGKLRSLQLPQ